MKSAAHHNQKQAEMHALTQTAQYAGDMRESVVAIGAAIAELRAELAAEAAEREAAAAAPAPAGE